MFDNPNMLNWPYESIWKIEPKEKKCKFHEQTLEKWTIQMASKHIKRCSTLPVLCGCVYMSMGDQAQEMSEKTDTDMLTINISTEWGFSSPMTCFL